MQNTNQNNILGKRIKQIRKSLKLTQQAFCNKIDLEISNLSKIERGKSEPSLQTILKIIQVLNIEPNELFDKRNFDRPETFSDLLLKNFNMLSLSKQIMVIKILMLINEEDKNSF